MQQSMNSPLQSAEQKGPVLVIHQPLYHTSSPLSDDSEYTCRGGSTYMYMYACTCIYFSNRHAWTWHCVCVIHVHEHCPDAVLAQFKAQLKLLTARPGSLIVQLDPNPAWRPSAGVDATDVYKTIYSRCIVYAFMYESHI